MHVRSVKESMSREIINTYQLEQILPKIIVYKEDGYYDKTNIE